MEIEQHNLSEPLPLDGITLKNGMAWLVYTNKGPLGVCGQSMDITCSRIWIHLWGNEDAMRADLEGKSLESLGRNGRQSQIEYGVIGEWYTGDASITVHGDSPPPVLPEQIVRLKYPDAECVKYGPLFVVQHSLPGGAIGSLSLLRTTEAEAWACAARTLEMGRKGE